MTLSISILISSCTFETNGLPGTGLLPNLTSISYLPAASGLYLHKNVPSSLSIIGNFEKKKFN